MIRLTAELFWTPPEEELRYLPEGPRFLQHHRSGENLLGWVAIQHGPNLKSGSFNILNLDTLQNTRHDLPGRPGFFAETDAPETIVIGLERRIVYYNWLTRELTETGVDVTFDERVIINDGVAVPEGLIFGTKDIKFRDPIAAAYRYDSATQWLTTLIPNETCSNGKYLAGNVLYEIDSPRKVLDRYELDGMRHSIAADFQNFPGFPDGLRPTRDGKSVVIAFYDPGESRSGFARQISLATGKVEAEWELRGSPRVTCPEIFMLNGKERVLFTTAVEGMPERMLAQAPNAGALFVAEPYSGAGC
jgi:sugar lactone lactonase YvrE